MKQDTSTRELPPEAAAEARLFRHTLPYHILLHETARFLGPMSEARALDIGAPNAMMSYLLRKRGGEWSSVTLDAGLSDLWQPFTGATAAVWDGKALPYENKQFDYVIVFDGLESQSDDGAFIEECHRVLKADGRLILNVRHRKPLQVLSPLRRLLRRDAQSLGRPREGYTDTQLFALLKNGFDVHQVKSYSRFNIELIDLIRQVVIGARHERGTGQWLRGIDVFAHIAYQIDMLMFMLRGYRLVASAKRRAWLPRNVPVLSDGRRITDAVLSRPDI